MDKTDIELAIDLAKKEEYDIKIFADMMDSRLQNSSMAGITYQPMAVGEKAAEYRFAPSNRTMEIHLDGTMLQIRTSWSHQAIDNITIDLYKQEEWAKIEEVMERFIGAIEEDMTFGEMRKEMPTKDNNWYSPVDVRPSCTKCNATTAQYRIPDRDRMLVEYRCADCFVGEPSKCVLCGGPSDQAHVDRICVGCMRKIVVQAIQLNLPELRQIIVDAAGELFSEISRQQTDDIVSRAKMNI